MVTRDENQPTNPSAASTATDATSPLRRPERHHEPEEDEPLRQSFCIGRRQGFHALHVHEARHRRDQDRPNTAFGTLSKQPVKNSNVKTTAPAVTIEDNCEEPPVTTFTALENDPATAYDWKADPATFAAPTARISCDVSSFLKRVRPGPCPHGERSVNATNDSTKASLTFGGGRVR